jgi:hypothetical protein
LRCVTAASQAFQLVSPSISSPALEQPFAAAEEDRNETGEAQSAEGGFEE